MAKHKVKIFEDSLMSGLESSINSFLSYANIELVNVSMCATIDPKMDEYSVTGQNSYMAIVAYKELE